jgi:hypothetical protein
VYRSSEGGKRRFGTAYESYVNFLQMAPTVRPETSLTNLPPTPHNISEEQRAHMDRRGSLQSPEDHFLYSV